MGYPYPSTQRGADAGGKRPAADGRPGRLPQGFGFRGFISGFEV